MSQQIAYPHTLRDILEEYKEKQEQLEGAILAFKQAEEDIEQSVQVVGGFIAGSLIKPNYIYMNTASARLRASAWKALYLRLHLDRVLSASDKNKFEQSLENPPELTLENLTNAFGAYWENPRYFILKGLAEVFCKLDKFYKSHSNFGIGVKGLPKRVILSNFNSWHTRDKFIDMCTAMLQVTGESVLKVEEVNLIRDKSYDVKGFELERLGLTVKTFANGNAHVHFSPRALQVVNDGLHEFYGNVLPDDAGEKPSQKQASTDVSKDLQYYPTPKAVIDIVISQVSIKGCKVLEPSCGDGNILDAIRKNGGQGYGIEYHAGRADQAREKGHSVLTANFLEVEPSPVYDYVLMNPPFSGIHYIKHVEHALRFLKDGGTLITILPANAWYEHKKLKGRWSDLPISSFRESGTNVNTGYLMVRK